MFCTQCGDEQREDAKFCHSCGYNHLSMGNTPTPKMTVQETNSGNKVNTEIREFYVVPVGKFIFLSFVTFGLYEIFWFVKNWQMVKDQEKSSILPIARAIFSIFFFSEFGNKVLKSAKERGYDKNYSSVFLAVSYFVSNILFNLPDIFWLLGFVSILTFIPILEAILYNNEKSSQRVYNFETYKTGEIVSAIVGSLLWLLIFIGLTA